MHTLTDDELEHAPRSLVADAQRGEATIVTVGGAPVLMSVPLGMGTAVQGALIELAATLFDREQISLGPAARMSGLAYSEMIDELGRRQIAIIRPAPGDLERELAVFGA